MTFEKDEFNMVYGKNGWEAIDIPDKLLFKRIRQEITRKKKHVQRLVKDTQTLKKILNNENT